MMTSPAGSTIAETNLRVLIADEDEKASARAAAVLAELGHEVTPYAVSVREAVELIAREDPQVAIVVVHNDDEHALALIAEAVEFASGPVIAQLRGRRRRLPLARGRARHLRVRGVDGPGDGTGRDRDRRAPVPRGQPAERKVEQLEGALERRG